MTVVTSAPIGGDSFEEFVHRELLVFKHMLLQGCQAVGDGTQTCALDIGGVVTCASAVVVASPCDAIVDEEREERGWGIEREHAFDVVVHRQFQVHEVNHLLVIGIVQFLV